MCSKRIGPEDKESRALYSPNERFFVTADTIGSVLAVYREILQREELPDNIEEGRLRASLATL